MTLGNYEREPVETQVLVRSGDIARITADALVTPINSGGLWFGALDGVIQRNGGMQFHQQAGEKLPLNHGDTVVATTKVNHRGAFGDVVFVIDDLLSPLSDVFLSSLIAADEAGYTSVSVPTMRMGVMMGKVEKTYQEVADQMKQAISRFRATGPKALESIVVVVYNDPQAEDLLRATLT
jgi:O-acetyl-ADP-ribose deacetylase (regulator of RNase III)